MKRIVIILCLVLFCSSCGAVGESADMNQYISNFSYQERKEMKISSKELLPLLKKNRRYRMGDSCCASNNNVMLLACSGGSNVGQLSNRAAVELTQEGFGKMYCLAGIGGRLKGFVQSAKDVPVIAAIDGCSVGCAKAILKNADISRYNHIVLTDLGIEKNKDFNLSEEHLAKVKGAVVAVCNGQKSAAETNLSSRIVGCCG